MGAKPVDAGRVIKQRQPVIVAIARAADKGWNMGEAQEPVPRDLTVDGEVAIGQAKRR